MAKKGYKQTMEHKNNRSISLNGHFVSEITKEKIRNKAIGRKHSVETKLKFKGRIPINKGKTKENYLPLKIVSEKMKEARKNKYWKNVGYKHSEITKKKMKDNHADFSRNKNANWQGGKSFEVYTIDWTQTLKKSIRERDKYICQICNRTQNEFNGKLHIHHIDYNKKNCNIENLVSLCIKCHCKTNWNREKWTKYFRRRLHDI